MKKGIVLALLACVAFSCAERPQVDPFQASLEDYVRLHHQELKKFSITEFTIEKKVTVNEELDRRKALFVTKRGVLQKQYEDYKSQRKLKTAAAKKKELDATEDILQRIEEYRENNKSILDSIIYVVVDFTGEGKDMDGNKVTYPHTYATMTSDRMVKSITSTGTNPYAGMGTAIPGYVEYIIKDIIEEE